MPPAICIGNSSDSIADSNACRAMFGGLLDQQDTLVDVIAVEGKCSTEPDLGASQYLADEPNQVQSSGERAEPFRCHDCLPSDFC